MESKEMQTLRTEEIKQMRRKLLRKIINIESKRRSVRTISMNPSLQGATSTTVNSMAEYRKEVM